MELFQLLIWSFYIWGHVWPAESFTPQPSGSKSHVRTSSCTCTVTKQKNLGGLLPRAHADIVRAISGLTELAVSALLENDMLGVQEEHQHGEQDVDRRPHEQVSAPCII